MAHPRCLPACPVSTRATEQQARRAASGCIAPHQPATVRGLRHKLEQIPPPPYRPTAAALLPRHCGAPEVPPGAFSCSNGSPPLNPPNPRTYPTQHCIRQLQKAQHGLSRPPQAQPYDPPPWAVPTPDLRPGLWRCFGSIGSVLFSAPPKSPPLPLFQVSPPPNRCCD